MTCPKTAFFFMDGGGIKIYARSYPTIERVEVVGNCTSPCGAGVSVEHLGFQLLLDAAVFPRTASSATTAPRLPARRWTFLKGSRVTLDNCLFVRGNISNLGVDYIGMLTGGEYHTENGSGAMTVFEGSRAEVSRCTFTGNWAGVDDNGTGSTYVKSIFWNNTLKGGISTGPRYEIDITSGGGVRGSFIHGETNDLRGTIDRKVNTFDPPDPRFDAQFVPQAPEIPEGRWATGRLAPHRVVAPAGSCPIRLSSQSSQWSNCDKVTTVFCLAPGHYVSSLSSRLRIGAACNRAFGAGARRPEVRFEHQACAGSVPRRTR